MLHRFISAHRDLIIRRCQERAAARSPLLPRTTDLDHGVPLFLDQLAETLGRGLTSSPEIGKSALLYGHALLLQGLAVSEVVHAYGDVRQSIIDLAMETHTSISTDDFRTLNRCVDEAIAAAVTEHARGQEGSRSTRCAVGSERFGYLAHELRNLTNTAMIAFELLKEGNVGVAGSTGTVLQGSLLGIGSLIGRSLDEVRLTQGVHCREPFLVSNFLDELLPAAISAARVTGVGLTVPPVDHGTMIEADRQVLDAVVEDLLQNAIKFTRPHTAVTLRVAGSADRVLIEIEDRCGGVPGGDVAELFDPVRARAVERTRFGLGLPFCRWAVEANRGRMYARDLPDEGCVFTVDLPRVTVPAPAAGR